MGVRQPEIASHLERGVRSSELKAPRDQAIAMSRAGHRVFDALERLHAVTVACISGVAAGGGLEVTLACDFRIAVRGVLLGLPESSLGLLPGWGGTKRLAALVGLPAAKRLMYSAKLIKAEEALELGLVAVQSLLPSGRAGRRAWNVCWSWGW